MTVRELIAKLQELNPDLPVAVPDWEEAANYPSIEALEVNLVTDGPIEDDDNPPPGFTVKPGLYTPRVNQYWGSYVCIGRFPIASSLDIPPVKL